MAPGKAAQMESRRSPLWLKLGFWICIFIAVAVVVRRILALASPSRSGPPNLVQMDNVFASHAALTLAHILPALVFVLLAPVVVFWRTGRPAWIDRAFYVIGAIVGLTAYAMSVYSVGGWTERSAVLFFDSLFLISLLRALLVRRNADAVSERRWQLRAVAVLLGISTTRPVMGVFFATASRTHLLASQFFGIAFWIGFSINVFIFELWIWSADRRTQRAAVAGFPAPPTAQGR